MNIKDLMFWAKKEVFLDYASTTPVLREVEKVMKPFWRDNFANPSALYKSAVLAKKAVENARRSAARSLGVRSQEIYFTSGGTESDNMAILGIFEYYKNKFTPHIITTTIEHPAVLEACREVEKRGGKITYINPKENGIVSPEDIFSAITANTVLISVMLVNNEIGTIEPVSQISRLVKKYREDNNTVLPFIHTDASQAPNYISILVSTLGVDMMTIDAGKIYGPKGVGLLFIKRGLSIAPISFGGGQEQGLRSGTENVPALVGLAKALSIAVRDAKKESERLGKLQKYLFTEIKKLRNDIVINGDEKNRLPNNVNFCVPNILGEFTVIKLDTMGVSVSSLSACGNIDSSGESYVVKSLGRENCASSSIRVTMGRYTKKSDLVYFLKCLKSIIVK